MPNWAVRRTEYAQGLRHMRIAAAQTTSQPGDVAANVQTHLRFAAAAAAQQVQVLVFPELSLTGYELPELVQHMLTPDAAPLQALRAAARQYGMVLVVGAPAAPARVGGKPAIGAWVLEPNGGCHVYRKRHLHPPEAAYASAGGEDAQLHTWGDLPMALAICADIATPAHAAAASAAGAQLYLAGVLISAAGYAADAALACQHAKTHGLGVLLANHGAPSGGYASAGRSAFWAPDGTLAGEAPGTGDWLLLAQQGAAGWTAQAMAVAA